MTVAPRMLRKSSGPEVELNRVLQQRGPARQEQLIQLSERYPDHAPVWAELAEEHLNKRRKEEALHAARRSLQLDRKIFRRFSPRLREACEHFLFEFSGAPSPDGADPEPKLRHPNKPPAQVYGRLQNAREISKIAVKIAKAKALKGSERRRKLEELTRQHPNEGRTWLALAEEHIEGRRVEEALDAVERAITLEPELERNLSRKLMNARRYRKAGIEASSSSKKPAKRVAASISAYGDRSSPSAARPPATAATAGAGRQPAPDPPVAGVAASRAPQPGPAPRPPVPAAPRGAQPAPMPGMGESSVGKHLASALEVRDCRQRLTALRSLEDMAPENPAVLFHLAIEAALAGDTDDAQRAGATLRRVSPERYEKLYALAETYWPSRVEASNDGDGGREAFKWTPSVAKTSIFTPPAEKATREPLRLTELLPAAGSFEAVPVPPAPVSPELRPPQAPPQPSPVPRPHAAPQPAPIPRATPRPPPVVQPSPQAVAAPSPFSAPPLLSAPILVQGPRGTGPLQRSPWRTAGALAAGVAAGLLFALLLVIVLSRLDGDRSSSRIRPAPSNQAAISAPSPSHDAVAPSSLAPSRDTVHRAV